MLDMIDDAVRQVMERQGWSEGTVLVLALRFIEDQRLTDEWFASLLESALEESPDTMDVDEDTTEEDCVLSEADLADLAEIVESDYEDPEEEDD